jgi:hypothetical protein
MIVITRTVGESLRIADVLVTLQSIDGNSISLAFNLPDDALLETSDRHGIAWLRAAREDSNSRRLVDDQ